MNQGTVSSVDMKIGSKQLEIRRKQWSKLDHPAQLTRKEQQTQHVQKISSVLSVRTVFSTNQLNGERIDCWWYFILFLQYVGAIIFDLSKMVMIVLECLFFVTVVVNRSHLEAVVAFIQWIRAKPNAYTILKQKQLLNPLLLCTWPILRLQVMHDLIDQYLPLLDDRHLQRKCEMKFQNLETHSKCLPSTVPFDCRLSASFVGNDSSDCHWSKHEPSFSSIWRGNIKPVDSASEAGENGYPARNSASSQNASKGHSVYTGGNGSVEIGRKLSSWFVITAIWSMFVCKTDVDESSTMEMRDNLWTWYAQVEQHWSYLEALIEEYEQGSSVN